MIVKCYDLPQIREPKTSTNFPHPGRTPRCKRDIRLMMTADNFFLIAVSCLNCFWICCFWDLPWLPWWMFTRIHWKIIDFESFQYSQKLQNECQGMMIMRRYYGVLWILYDIVDSLQSESTTSSFTRRQLNPMNFLAIWATFLLTL